MIPQPRRPHAVRSPAARALLVMTLAALTGCTGGPAPSRSQPLLLVSTRGGALRIYEMDREAGVATLLGSERADDTAWSDTMPARLPDDRVAFISDREGRPALYLAASGSTAATAVPLVPVAGPAATAPPADSDPAPFGPGRVVFARAANAGAPRDLFVVNLDGSGLRPLTTHPADEGAPCALPDRRTIVFVSDRDGARRLYRIDAEAADAESTVVPLMPDAPRGVADGAPACLADGSILFARAAGGRPAQIFAFDPGLAHAAPRQVTEATILPSGAGEPVALDDGFILMTAGPAGTGARGRGPRYAVYRISRGGYNLSRVTRDGAGYDDMARGLEPGR